MRNKRLQLTRPPRWIRPRTARPPEASQRLVYPGGDPWRLRQPGQRVGGQLNRRTVRWRGGGSEGLDAVLVPATP
jgi:hypothetical protein